jgi:hypothetical protein
MKRNFFNTRLMFFVLAGLIIFTLSWARSTHSVENLVSISAIGVTHATYTDCCNRSNCGKYRGDFTGASVCINGCGSYSACSYTSTTTDTLSAPTGVSATAASSSKITVSWNSVNKATGYFVYRGTTSSSLSKKATFTSTSYSDTGLTASTTYYYCVYAYSSSDTSAKSTTVSATTSSAAPGTPSGVTTTTVSSSSIKVAWTTVNGATGYYVYRGISSASFSQKANVTTNLYTDTGLSANTTYYYGIASYNSSGTSDTSTFVNAKTNTTGTLPSKNSFISTMYNGDRIIEAYLPNGRLAASTRVFSTVTAKSEAITGLCLRAGVYHLVIRDAATGNKLAFERAVIVK